MATPVPFQPVVVASNAPVPALARRRKLGEALLETGAIARASLDDALERQKHWEAPLGRLLLTEGAVSPDELLQGLADQANVPVIDLAANPPEATLLAGLDPFRCLEIGAVPWRQVGGVRLIAVSHVEAFDAAAAAFANEAPRVAPVVAGAEEIRRAITLHFSDELRDGARLRCPPAYSCRSLGLAGARTAPSLSSSCCSPPSRRHPGPR